MVTPVCEIRDIQSCEHKIGLGGCIHLQIVFQLHSHSQATFFLLDATYIGAGSYSPDSKMFCWVELQVYKIKVKKVNLETGANDTSDL